MKKINKIIKIIALILLLNIFIVNINTVYIFANTNEKLEDNVLEYTEIEERIRYFNPSIKSANESYDKAITDLKSSIEDLENAKRKIEELLNSSISAGNLIFINLYSMQKLGLNTSIKNLQKAKDNLEKPISKSNASLRMAEKSIVLVAKNLYISYLSLLEQENILTSFVKMNESIFNTKLALNNVSMNIDANVLKAKNELLLASNNLESLRNSKDMLKYNLLILLGYDISRDISVEAISKELNIDFASINFEEDLKKADSNNMSLVSFRNTRKNSSTYQNSLDEIKETDLENKLKIAMNKQYSNLKEADINFAGEKLLFEASSLAYNKANISKKLGMISDSEYIASNVSYISGNSSYNIAYYDYLLKYEIYKTAVEGIVDLE